MVNNMFGSNGIFDFDMDFDKNLVSTKPMTRTIVKPKLTYSFNKKENLIVYQDDIFVPTKVFNDGKTEIENDKNIIRVGEFYALTRPSCDGISYKPTIYKVYGIVNQYYKFDINGVIVKQVEGEKNRIFTLTRSQCSDLGIDYEDELQILPLSLPWEHVNYNSSSQGEKEFNPNDMSTFRTYDGFIKFVTVKLKGFRPYAYDGGQIITPNDVSLNTHVFKLSLGCSYNHHLVPFKIITNYYTNGNNNLICDSEGEIYIAIDLSKYNIKPQDVNGVSFQDICKFSWKEIVEETVEVEDTTPKPHNEADPFGIMEDMVGAVDGMIRTIDGTTAEIFKDGHWQGVAVSHIDKSKLKLMTNNDMFNLMRHATLSRGH